MKSVKIRAEGATLTLEPVLENVYKQRLYVAKNPSNWRTKYSLWAYVGKGWGRMLVSHHSTKSLAEKAAKRLKNRDVLRVLGWRK